MLLYQFLGIFLLGAPWHLAVAFRARVPLPQLRGGRNNDKHGTSSTGGERKHPAADAAATSSSRCSTVAATSTSATTTTDPSPPPQGFIPRWKGGVSSDPTVAVKSFATRSTSVTATVDVTRNEKCGASSPSSAVTRSQILSSMAAAAAGLVLAPPRQASATESTTVKALEVQDLVGGSAEEGAAAKYMVGSDEVRIFMIFASTFACDLSIPVNMLQHVL